MESRRYISLAFWAKERHERASEETRNVISLPNLLEAVVEDAFEYDGQVSPLATSVDEAA